MYDITFTDHTRVNCSNSVYEFCMACEQMFIISKYCFNVTYVNVYIMGLLQTVPLSESSKVETV